MRTSIFGFPKKIYVQVSYIIPQIELRILPADKCQQMRQGSKVTYIVFAIAVDSLTVLTSGVRLGAKIKRMWTCNETLNVELGDHRELQVLRSKLSTFKRNGCAHNTHTRNQRQKLVAKSRMHSRTYKTELAFAKGIRKCDVPTYMSVKCERKNRLQAKWIYQKSSGSTVNVVRDQESGKYC